MSSERKESIIEDATLKLRQELTGASGPRALVKNSKVFGLSCFACLGCSVKLNAPRRKDLPLAPSRLRNLAQDDPLIELGCLEIKAQSVFEKRNAAEKWPHLVEMTPMDTFKLQFVAIGSLFTTKAMFGRVITATVTMLFQQFTVINAVLYYAPSIFEALGTSSNTTSLLATGVVGVAAIFLATIPAVLYIDKLGRKPVMPAGSLGMGICHFTIPVIFAKNRYQWATHKTAGWAAVAMVWFFYCQIWLQLEPLSGPSPTAPTESPSAPPQTGCQNFIVGQSTPDMLTRISYGTFISYGLMTAGGALFLWFYVPETKRLTLEETDVVSGSVDVARADSARMQEIHREIGLDDALRNMGIRTSNERSDSESDVVLRSEEKEEIGVKALVWLLVVSG
ncbi:MAG: hypothetical protein Q9198_001367 [Flavoplaca austrocitrina]